jgi:hypothetical protein
MFSMKTWMLGAAVLAGGLALSTPRAQAAGVRVYLGGPAAYVPPCPGPGYFWIDGYYSGSYWVPGRWEFRGVYDRDHFYRGHDFYRDHDRRDWDHDRSYRGDHDRGDHFRR